MVAISGVLSKPNAALGTVGGRTAKPNRSTRGGGLAAPPGAGHVNPKTISGMLFAKHAGGFADEAVHRFKHDLDAVSYCAVPPRPVAISEATSGRWQPSC
jgi:hypothetical protein